MSSSKQTRRRSQMTEYVQQKKRVEIAKEGHTSEAQYKKRYNTRLVTAYVVAHVATLVAGYLAGYWAGCVICSFIDDWSSSKPTEIENDLKNTIATFLKGNFPAQRPDLWWRLLSLFKAVATGDATCPKVLLLLYNEDSKSVCDLLVKQVGEVLSPKLRTKDPKPLYLTESNSNLNSDSVRRHGSVFIQNLQDLSLEVIEKLHFYCDEHDSSFGGAVYILTMKVSNRSMEDSQEVTAAEEAFCENWPKMKEERREALISRLTSLVEFIKPEKS